jgi:hypothetical protein
LPKLTFEIALAIGGTVLTVVLLVLDKAEKLKGPVLYGLLCLAALTTLPLVLGNPLVVNAVGPWKYWYRSLGSATVILGFWAIGIWISPSRHVALIDESR